MPSDTVDERAEEGTVDGDPVAGERRELDAREIDGEPFDRIVEALDALPRDGTLVLVNGFEPEPLYPVLERRGFTHRTSRGEEGEWRVSITHA